MPGKTFSTKELLKPVTNADRPGVMDLDIAKIVRDQGTQPRDEMNDGTIAEYADAMAHGAVFPPVIVFFDGKRYILADGFHRCAAAEMNDQQAIAAEVRQGDLREAILFSVSANAGLPRTDGDKWRAVERLLRDEEWNKWSNREIANHCRVSHSFVGKVRAGMGGVTGFQNPVNAPTDERTYTNRHGTQSTMNTGRIREANQQRAKPRDGNADAVRGGSSRPAHSPALKPDPAADQRYGEKYEAPARHASARKFRVYSRLEGDEVVNLINDLLANGVEFDVVVQPLGVQ